MKLILEGYNKSIHKKDNQIVIHEKGEIIDSIKASKVKDITIIGKGYITFDALNLIAKNNIKLISLTYNGKINYVLELQPQTRDYLHFIILLLELVLFLTLNLSEKNKKSNYQKVLF